MVGGWSVTKTFDFRTLEPYQYVQFCKRISKESTEKYWKENHG